VSTPVRVLDPGRARAARHHAQLSGTLTRRSVDALDHCIAEALADGPRRLVFELSVLDHIDDDALECLTSARNAARTADISVVVDTPNRVVRELLEARCGADAFLMR
jgi:anti-anti-sigma regulatory factor